MDETTTRVEDDWRWHPVRKPSDDTFYGWGVQKAFRNNSSLANGTDYLDQFVGMDIEIRCCVSDCFVTDFSDYFGGQGAGFFGLFGFYRLGMG